MKQALTLMFLFVYISTLKGQKDCIIKWPNNTQPDTVSIFIFSNKLIKASSLLETKPTSNFSFNVKVLNVSWMSIKQNDVDSFILSSVKSIKINKIIDTLNCSVLGQSHKTIVVKAKRKRLLYMYLKQADLQDVFVVEVYNARKVQQTIEYLESHLL